MIGNNNHKKAWNYFVSIGKMPPTAKKWEYVLHHKDPRWKTEDPERYAQWNIEDLMPMTNSEHAKLHGTGKVCLEETKMKISNANSGKNRTEEQKNRISETTKAAMKKIPREIISPWKGKSSPVKGRIWINDGTNLRRIRKDEPIPDGWTQGYLPQSKNETE